jgi:hypothetical protein
MVVRSSVWYRQYPWDWFPSSLTDVATRQKPSRRATRSTNDNSATRPARVEAAVGKLTRSRLNVRREEHDAVLAALRKVGENAYNLEQHTHDLDVQFKRIAQMQADLDDMKRAWQKAKLLA